MMSRKPIAACAANSELRYLAALSSHRSGFCVVQAQLVGGESLFALDFPKHGCLMTRKSLSCVKLTKLGFNLAGGFRAGHAPEFADPEPELLDQFDARWRVGQWRA